MRVAGVGGAGAIWGLGLARLVAEAGFCPLLYGSPPAVAAVAALCAAIALLPALRRLHASSAVGQSPLDEDALGLRSPVQPSQGFGRNALVTLPHSPFSILHSPLVIGHWSLVIDPWFFVLPLLYVTGVVSGPLAGCTLLVGGAVLALLVAWGDRIRWLPPAVLGLATLALYLRTLLPSVGQADTFEFQVVVPQLAVAHPTGYPLYVLLGKLFTLLPVGPAAWRVNLASAVFATAAVLVLYALLLCLAAPRQDPAGPGRREAQPGHRTAQSTARWLPPFVAALAFAFSSTFWSQAVIAEVYTLHNLLVAAILWLLLAQAKSSEAFAARRWQATCFLLGLSLTNHLTTALLLPAVALALAWDRPRLRRRDWLVAGALLLLGLSVYLFIPLRWPALNRGEWMTPREFVTYVTGGQFHAALRLDGWRDPVRWGIVGRMLREPFGWAGLGLAAVGVAGLAVRRRRALALTGVTFLAFVLYGLDYYVPDISVFLLPAHLILALWLAAGISTLSSCLLPLASRLLPPASSTMRHFSSVIGHWSLDIGHWTLVIGHWSLFIFSVLLPLSLIWLNLPAVDRSHDQGGYAWGRYVLSLPLAPGSAVLADVAKFAPLYYLQQIERVRPDLDLLLFGSEELYQAELAARLATGQTVYLARYLPDLGGLHLRSLGPLVEVRVNEERVDEERGDEEGVNEGREGGVGVSFGEGVRLLDAELSADPLGRDLYHLTLSWRAEAPVGGDLLVRLRLVDAGGQVRWESDGARPVGGLYPTNAWPVDAAIADYHEVRPPPWLPRGEYVLEVGLFPPFSDVGLQVGDRATAWLALAPVEVAPPGDPLPPLPHERRCSFAGGAWLTGYNLALDVPAGASFTVDLSWHGVEADEEVRLAWVGAGGREAGAAASSLATGALRTRHVVTAPPNPGAYTLVVGLAGEAVRCSWLAPSTGDCPLATVEVAPVQKGLANFAGQVLLLDAAVSTNGQAGVRPGGTVPVVLRWQALRAMDEDYTVFVHLVGPDGRLHGQVDMWPVQGSFPTSRWTPGEEIADPYEVRLAPGAPPGQYRVEVGWYLLATMQRLPVVDADGRPTGDSFVVGQFSVTE
ncbi:MAG TPA: DUF2723 domain-containing protein [Anaerolineae bacterium]|nr:DUF2723 domain-containing protein [Anaerolineae bacterium]